MGHKINHYIDKKRFVFILSVFLWAFLVFYLSLVQSNWFFSKRLVLQSYLPKTADKSIQYLALEIGKNNQLTNTKKPAIPLNGAYLAVDTDIKEDNLGTFENLIKKKVAFLNIYVYWGEKVTSYNDLLTQTLNFNNQALLITWNPSRSVLNHPINQKDHRIYNISNGSFDDYLSKWCAKIKNCNTPVIIRFAPEMNGDWLPWGTKYSTPDQYIKAYRYVVRYFKKRNVSNVSWMWSPNESGSQNILKWYPGDKYVDWVGLSGFNWSGLSTNNDWRSFNDVYAKSFSELESIDKPIALAEVGCAEVSDESKKAEWITDAFIEIKNNPKIKMVTWFNGVSFKKYDWRVNSSRQSLQAFQCSVANPYFLSGVTYEK